MQEPDLLAIFARPLHSAGMRYLVAGSLGSMLYSEPRLTIDVDFAVALVAADLKALGKLFPPPEFYTPPLEIISAENARECRAHFNVIHVPTGMKADFYPSQRDAFFGWAWRNRRTVTDIHFAPPEYIIVWKVAYFAEGGGEKHVRDIRRMLDLSGGEIDLGLLREELGRRNLGGTFRSMTE